MDSLLLCYNKGCGVKFNPAENRPDSCTYHPGAPVFHDAYKGWSCCNKRSTDFTTFLNMKGCSKGLHNPEKPKEPEKPTKDDNTRDEVIIVTSLVEEHLPRPDVSMEMSRLPVTVAASLKSALKKQKDYSEVKSDETTEYSGIKPGESCKNNGCKKSYEGEHSSLEVCCHHPGFPIFHEGMKYWTCCNRKTSDFNEFLEQQGCSSGSHVWVKKNKKMQACRYDWHQTGSHVYISIYAKNAHPSETHIDVNPVRLCTCIVFGDKSEFKEDWELTGVIDTAESNATLAATKVEIKLRKAEPGSWKDLFIKKKAESIEDEDKAPDGDESLSVDTIDLSDI